MKTTRGNSQQGSALLIAIIMCLLIGFVLASYLGLITSRNRASMRATAWNTAIPVLEAGIEEALTHLHDDSDKLTANQWDAEVVNGQSIYSKRRILPDGSQFSVTISNAATPSPVIRSVGYVQSPLKKDEFISRVVEVGMTNPPTMFLHAIAANGAVNLSGGAVVDGYDSTAGPYNLTTNRNASGGIATNSKQVKAINIGTAHLYGRAVTELGGTVDLAGGSVGPLDRISGTEDGWITDNMNVQFQPNSPPGGMPLSPSVAGGTNFLGNGDFRMDSVNINSASKPMIITGKATLWVKGDFVVSGVAPNAGYIYIAPGASLMLYVGGTTTSISGGGIINGTGPNGTGDPKNFSYFGLPTNKTMTYSGTANFVGTINAPKADFSLSGGTSVYGAVICNSFTSTGGSSVHYDQATAIKGILLVTSWREL